MESAKTTVKQTGLLMVPSTAEKMEATTVILKGSCLETMMANVKASQRDYHLATTKVD